jgi:hypothetical protein
MATDEHNGWRRSSGTGWTSQCRAEPVDNLAEQGNSSHTLKRSTSEENLFI